MKFLVATVLCVLVCQGQAASWWFSGSSDEDGFDENAVIEADEDVTAECLQQAAWGECAFYDCMEERYPCGPDGYNQKISKHFCSKIATMLGDPNNEGFDAFGRRWLNQTSVCLVSYMLPMYRDQSSTTCGAIKEAGINGVIGCNEGTVDGHDFCHFLNTNGDAYKSLMGREEVSLLVSLRNRRVFQSMISNTLTCSLEDFSSFVSSTTDRFTNLMGSLWNRIWG